MRAEINGAPKAKINEGMLSGRRQAGGSKRACCLVLFINSIVVKI